MRASPTLTFPATTARSRRARRLAVVVLIVASLAYGIFDGAMRYHSRALATEWWQCLVSRSPPDVGAELLDRFPAAQAADLAAHPAPTTNPRELVGRSRAAVQSGKYGYADITVAVVDSGIASGTIGDALVAGLDTVNPCGNGTSDANGHGTAVAGIIASPEHGAAAGVRILPVRTSLSTGVQLRWANAAAVVWATNRGANVINLSSSSQSSTPSVVERSAIRYAVSRGVVLVAAAGNSRYKSATYPAGYPDVISVTSTDGDGALSSFAARRGRIDVAAPGGMIETTGVDGQARVVSGTSFAAPFVSAVVARLLAVNPDLSPDEVAALLRDTASALPDSAWELADVPFGLINVDAALKAAGVALRSGAFGRHTRPAAEAQQPTVSQPAPRLRIPAGP